MGENRAEASLQRPHQLNLKVEVTTDTANAKDKDAKFFKKFDIVVATNCPKDKLVRIYSICRAGKVLFSAGKFSDFSG